MNSRIKVSKSYLQIFYIEKNIVINKDNQNLLRKLVEISHGKWVYHLNLSL